MTCNSEHNERNEHWELYVMICSYSYFVITNSMLLTHASVGNISGHNYSLTEWSSTDMLNPLILNGQGMCYGLLLLSTLDNQLNCEFNIWLQTGWLQTYTLIAHMS